MKPLLPKANINFLVINNGLKSLNGHYFETGVSVCQASTKFGLTPCMATNKVFQNHYKNQEPFPVLPIFQVDHWQNNLLTPAINNESAGRVYFPRITSKIQKLLYFYWNPSLFLELRKGKFFNEFKWMELYYKNLKDFLLPFKKLQSIVFCPTAHARELFAILEFNQVYNKNNTFSFHLEFRHPIKTLFSDSNFNHWDKYKQLNKIWFNQINRQLFRNIFLYCDTPELAKEYHDEFMVKFDTLPIPFRSSLMEKRFNPKGKIVLGYFGDARDEKGFEHLPLIHSYLNQKQDLYGKFKFIIQCTNANCWSGGVKVLSYFKNVNPEECELISIDKPMTDKEYYDNFSKADICLLPYDSGIYRSRSSGCLSEAIALGIPSIVPNSTWMANQLPRNCGGFFSNLNQLCEETYKVIKDYDFFSANIKELKQIWMARNSPDELVKKIIRNSLIDS